MLKNMAFSIFEQITEIAKLIHSYPRRLIEASVAAGCQEASVNPRPSHSSEHRWGHDLVLQLAREQELHHPSNHELSLLVYGEVVCARLWR